MNLRNFRDVILKAECFGKLIPETKQQAKLMIFNYIETFYNKHRKHSSLGMKSPDQFETLLAKKTNHN
jgi:transposase InsO family protein